MNSAKVISGVIAFIIYISIIFLILFFYNIHKTKAKNYVEKNSDRVTVTLVNSDKTVFNRRDKVTIPKKSVPKIVPPPVVPKKVIPKKVVRASKPIPKPKKVLPKKKVPKKVVPKKKVPKKVVPKKVLPKKKVPKKVVRAPKPIPKPKKIVPKKKVPKKVVPKKIVPKKKVPKKSAKDLFSSIKTERPVKRHPKHPIKQPVKRESSIKHNSSITDRIKATHQSGRVSNTNREKGVKNAYIAKVKRAMNNWDAVGMKGQWVTVNLTIYNSGKFRYTTIGVNGSMRESLKRYLDFLNRRGLGRHNKSTPYSIQVRFRAR